MTGAPERQAIPDRSVRGIVLNASCRGPLVRGGVPRRQPLDFVTRPAGSSQKPDAVSMRLASRYNTRAIGVSDEVLNAMVGVVSAVNAGATAATAREAFRMADSAAPESCGSLCSAEGVQRDTSA